MRKSLIEATKDLAKNDSASLESTFAPFFKQAQEMETEAKSIVVKSLDDTDQMENARTMRLKLKNIRIDVEKKRKELKEESLRKGKAIDGMANIIKFLIAPLEEHLEEQEKFKERLEEQVKKELKLKREAELGKYDYETEFIKLDEMSNEAYIILRDKVRKEYEEQKEAERKAEEDQAKKLKEEKIEQERTRKENEKLKKEAAQREAEIKIEREAKERTEAEQRAKHEAEIKIEREAKEKIEKEAKERVEAEQKEEVDKLRLIEDQKKKEKNDLFKKWLVDNKYNPVTDEYRQEGDKFILLRKISEITIK